MYVNNKDGSFTLFLNGNVGEDTILEDLNKILTEYPDTQKIEIMIDSVGGSLERAYNIVDFFENLKEKGVLIKTVVTGKAYSCASLITAAGTKGHRYLGQNAGVMVHKATINDPDYQFMDETVNVKFSEKMEEITGVNKDVFLNIFNTKKDFYFTSVAELREIGIIDQQVKYYSENEIQEQAKIVAQLEIETQKQKQNQIKMDQITQLQEELALAKNQITQLQGELSAKIAETKAIQEVLLKDADITAEQKTTIEGLPVNKMIELISIFKKEAKKEPIKQVDFTAAATAQLTEKSFLDKVKAGEKIENYVDKYAMQSEEVRKEIFNNYRETHNKNFKL